jgi:hypothetical protein
VGSCCTVTVVFVFAKSPSVFVIACLTISVLLLDIRPAPEKRQSKYVSEKGRHHTDIHLTGLD